MWPEVPSLLRMLEAPNASVVPPALDSLEVAREREAMGRAMFVGPPAPPPIGDAFVGPPAPPSEPLAPPVDERRRAALEAQLRAIGQRMTSPQPGPRPRAPTPLDPTTLASYGVAPPPMDLGVYYNPRVPRDFAGSDASIANLATAAFSRDPRLVQRSLAEYGRASQANDQFNEQRRVLDFQQARSDRADQQQAFARLKQIDNEQMQAKAAEAKAYYKAAQNYAEGSKENLALRQEGFLKGVEFVDEYQHSSKMVAELDNIMKQAPDFLQLTGSPARRLWGLLKLSAEDLATMNLEAPQMDALRSFKQQVKSTLLSAFSTVKFPGQVSDVEFRRMLDSFGESPPGTLPSVPVLQKVLQDLRTAHANQRDLSKMAVDGLGDPRLHAMVDNAATGTTAALNAVTTADRGELERSARFGVDPSGRSRARRVGVAASESDEPFLSDLVMERVAAALPGVQRLVEDNPRTFNQRTLLRAQTYLPMVYRAALEAGVPPEIYAGLITLESAWDPAAVSKTGVKGISQVTLETGREIFPEFRDRHRTDPFIMIPLGAQVLAMKIREAGGDVVRGLMRYSSGKNPNYPDIVMRYARYFGG